MEEFTPEEVVEASFLRTQVTVDYEADKTTEKNWTIIRDECDSGGAMDMRCNIVSASMGNGKLDVIAKRFRCGCLAIEMDAIEELDWDIGEQK